VLQRVFHQLTNGFVGSELPTPGVNRFINTRRFFPRKEPCPRRFRYRQWQSHSMNGTLSGLLVEAVVRWIVTRSVSIRAECVEMLSKVLVIAQPYGGFRACTG